MAINATQCTETRPALPALALGALGIVFGDIATSPLYALQEAFGAHGVQPTPDNILGLLSLVFWSLIGVVSLKYVLFIMRAHNHGEGGIMALLALAQGALRDRPRLHGAALAVGLMGAALFFGDSVITPAVSVLSAVEGLKLAAPPLQSLVLPLAVAILLGLFALQRFGSARVGRWFGPVMLAWLLAVGLLGAASLLRAPAVLAALSPHYALAFFWHNGFAGFTTLGAVVSVLTGAEALYADMGHFGARPIRVAWFVVALPCLLLSYFGQGALLLIDPNAAASPFYRMVPGWALYPMIALATAATVIASQAVITGAYSMAQEGMRLGLLPRMRVLHTSRSVRGQIHVPMIGALLLVLTLAATLGFRSSGALAASFGIAVSGTMLATTVLVLLVARHAWRWPLRVLVPLAAMLLTIDLGFFAANLMKLQSGGWFPLVLGLAAFTVMATWRRGRSLLRVQQQRLDAALEPVVQSLIAHPPMQVPGTAVYLTTDATLTPQALLHNLKHNKVLHARNVAMTVDVLEMPLAPAEQQVALTALGGGFYRLHARFGFAEQADVPEALERCGAQGFNFDLSETTFFTSRETLFPGERTGMARWRDALFAFLSRNALPAHSFFGIPDNRLIEIGRRVAI